MSRSRALPVVGILAGLAANYWALETLLADRTDPAGSWISDLGARTESTGLLFDLLEAGSGLLVIAFAALLRAGPRQPLTQASLGGLGAARRRRLHRDRRSLPAELRRDAGGAV